MKKRDINYSLVEKTRPPIYTAMKYWGKKPHNIWREYIENYTSETGLYLDPFTGSAISAFEAVKAGRKAITFDLNPLTTFIIEALTTNFDKNSFENEVAKIIPEVKKDKNYQYYFVTKCRKCGYDKAIAQNFKWDKGKIYEIGIECSHCVNELLKGKPSATERELKKVSKYLSPPNELDLKKASKINSIEIKTWYPNKKFHRSPSFSANFINCIGGNNFAFLWTKRNLYIISKIFNLILKITDEDLKKQLLFGFTQTIHLCTKMSVPRRQNANRPFSTSWGRSAYICSSRQMEMNPLLVFQSSCLGKQSVESSLLSAKEYFGKKLKILYVDRSNKSNRSKNFDIKYGIIDINTITDYIDEESIDFVMTDPPYGDLVQYFDLSSIWLIWLEKYDNRFKPNYDAEITIKKGIQNIDTYKLKFQNGIKNLFKMLKPDGKIVFTFNNKNIRIWNAFLNAISLAGFKIEKVIHQQNRRTGESNVANPYGTSATDFYIRCIKAPVVNAKTDKGEFEQFVINKAIHIIAQRNEPTSYQILFNGLLVEISEAGFDLKDFDENVESMLSKHANKIFKLTPNNKTKAGNYWWFMNPKEYIKYPDRLLTDRVEDSIIALLRRKVSVTFDEVLAEIFIKYINGLIPDIKSIDQILKKYANKSGGKWVYKGGKIEQAISKHTEILYYLSQIGKKLGYKIFIGKREQAEIHKEQKLVNHADILNLKLLNYDKEKIARIEMIDMVWINNENKIKYTIEVENSTKFTSGIQRASNLEKESPKLMVLPDEREKEFLGIKDPLFIENFKNYNWNYLLYSDVEKLKSLRTISKKTLSTFMKVCKYERKIRSKK